MFAHSSECSGVLTVSAHKQIQTSRRIVNIRVKTSVCGMMAYEEVKAPLHSFLTFPLDVNDQLHDRITLPLGIEPPVSRANLDAFL